MLRVNDRRVLNGLLADLGLLDRAVPVLRALDKIEKVGPDAVRAELAESAVDGAAADRVLAFAAARGDTDEQTFAAVAPLDGGDQRIFQIRRAPHFPHHLLGCRVGRTGTGNGQQLLHSTQHTAMVLGDGRRQGSPRQHGGEQSGEEHGVAACRWATD